MNQKQQIQLLESILPEIVESNDPEGAMLKCARKNNLSPAQLERLGQVFNTSKSLVGFRKQANRGDSFSIVDVPSMVSKYTTYDPDKSLSSAAAGVHRKVDRLIEKSASADKAYDPFSLDGSIEGLPEAVATAGTPSLLATVREPEMYEKSATAFGTQLQERRYLDVMRYSTDNIERARETASQVAYDTRADILEKCAGIMHKLTPDDGRWAECVRDLVDNFGFEKAAAVTKAVEDYFREKHHVFDTDFSKAAAEDHVFAKDRHGIVKVAEEMLDLMEINAMAKAALAKYDAARVDLDSVILKKAADDDGPTAAEAVLNFANDEKQALLNGLRNGAVIGGPETKPLDPVTSLKQNPVYNTMKLLRDPDKDRKEEMYIDDSKDEAEAESSIQELMMSDKAIAEADPSEVKALHRTIKSIAPTIARDPVMLAPVMREALQYGSLPIQQVKDLLAAEGAKAKADADKAKIRDMH